MAQLKRQGKPIDASIRSKIRDPTKWTRASASRRLDERCGRREDGPILWKRFTVVKDLGPKPIDGVVRVTAHEGSWRLEPEGASGTRAVYRFHFDAAGAIPSWLGKGQAQDDIIDFMQRLKRELPKYN